MLHRLCVKHDERATACERALSWTSIAPSHALPEAGQGMAPPNPPGLRPNPTALLRDLCDLCDLCGKLPFPCIPTQSRLFFVPSSCLGDLRGEKLRRPHTRAPSRLHPVRRLFENAKKLTKTPNHPPQKNENRRKFLIRPAQKRSFTRKRSQARTSAQKSRTGALWRA